MLLKMKKRPKTSTVTATLSSWLATRGIAPMLCAETTLVFLVINEVRTSSTMLLSATLLPLRARASSLKTCANLSCLRNVLIGFRLCFTNKTRR